MNFGSTTLLRQKDERIDMAWAEHSEVAMIEGSKLRFI